MFRYIKKQVLFQGSTGKVAFDDNGDRINAEYDIVNVLGPGQQISVGQYLYSTVGIQLYTSIYYTVESLISALYEIEPK